MIYILGTEHLYQGLLYNKGRHYYILKPPYYSTGTSSKPFFLNSHFLFYTYETKEKYKSSHFSQKIRRFSTAYYKLFFCFLSGRVILGNKTFNKHTLNLLFSYFTLQIISITIKLEPMIIKIFKNISRNIFDHYYTKSS